MTQLAVDPIASATTREARELLEELFADRTSLGAVMAVRSSAGLVEEELHILGGVAAYKHSIVVDTASGQSSEEVT